MLPLLLPRYINTRMEWHGKRLTVQLNDPRSQSVVGAGTPWKQRISSDMFRAKDGSWRGVKEGIPWRWRTRSGMIRAKKHILTYRKIVARILIEKLESNGIESEVYRMLRSVLAAYRLSNMDSPSFELLTELETAFNSKASEMEKNSAIMRQRDLVIQESLKGLDHIIESSGDDSE